MNNQPNTPQTGGGKDLVWREKYLESLDAQEKESAQLQETINTLRRGLLSVSLVGDGIDQDLDDNLAALRRQLHKLDQQAELNNLLQIIETKLLELDARKVEKTDGMMELLDIAAHNLGKLRFNPQHRRAIRKFTRSLKDPGNDVPAKLKRLDDFISLVASIMQSLLEESKDSSPGFLQRLFSAPTKQSKASKPKASPQSLDAPEPTKTPQETASTPTQQEEEPSSSDNREALKEAKTEQQSINELLNSDQPLLASDDALSLVKDFIYQQLDSVDPAQAIGQVASQLRSKLLSSQGEELKTCLVQIQNLLNLATANEQNELRKYLVELNHSLSLLQAFIGKSKHNSLSNKKLDSALDKDLRLQLSSIHTNIESVSDLSTMKTTIKQQLDSMVTTMDEAKESKQKAEEDYLTEISALGEKFAAVQQECQQLKQSMDNQKQAMEVDSLTKLPNRFAFNSRLKQEYETLRATTDPACLCLGDVDEFNQLNKRFGVAAGDKALQLIARQVNKQLGADQFLARYSGDKFVLLLPTSSAEQGLALLEAICQEIRNTPFKCKDEDLDITLSFGLTEMCREDSEHTAFERAEKALQGAKQEGGDGCQRWINAPK